MNKTLEAALLFAGTAIGSGMISLPIVLAKFGIFGSILIMLAFATLTYATACIRADLNLQTKAKATLGEVGKIFACPHVGILGDLCLQLLSFALMSAYLFGGASILSTFFDIQITTIILLFSCIVTGLLLFASKLILRLNKTMFVMMFTLLIIQVISLLSQVSISTIPSAKSDIQLSDWATLVPIIFTSFGFQGSIHSVTKFCNNDRHSIQKACFWGSFIPAIIYIIWTAAILLVLANTDTKFFQSMLCEESIEVGALIQALSRVFSIEITQFSIKIISFLAILTSVFGVGLALSDILRRKYNLSKVLSVLFVTVIPTVVAILIPNAFLRILNFSGILLAIIAIIVPTLISVKMRNSQTLKSTNLLLSNRLILAIIFALGVTIIVLGCLEWL